MRYSADQFKALPERRKALHIFTIRHTHCLEEITKAYGLTEKQNVASPGSRAFLAHPEFGEGGVE